MMIRLSFLVPMFLGASVAARVTTHDRAEAYPIHARPTTTTNRQLEWDENEEANISFDTMDSIAKIQALALEKAAAVAAQTAARGPTNNEASPHESSSCQDSLPESIFTTRFTFSVEYDPTYDPAQQLQRKLQSTAKTATTTSTTTTTQQLDSIVKGVEEELQERLATVVLVCESDTPEVLDANMVGLVRSPEGAELQSSTYTLLLNTWTLSCVFAPSRLTRCYSLCAQTIARPTVTATRVLYTKGE